MINKTIKILIGFLKLKLKNKIDPHSARSYSQEGEDMILRRFLAGQKDGFYVDVGAHHPVRFSNTYYFYKQGWAGINIEPNPDSLAAFKTSSGSY